MRQVHTNRIVAELGQFASGNRRAQSVRLQLFARRGGRDGYFVALGWRFVDQLNAHFIERDQQTIEFFRIDRFVGQVIVDLIVSQITLGLALGDQFVQILV